MGDNRSVNSVESSSELIFFVNGKKIVEENPNPEWSLLYYLRFKLLLSGTKEACGEGGCGACTVLASLCSVHGSAIITTEGIGSVRTGLHPAQERIAKSHGTQCGFCTPGFVMSMYALLRNNPEPTEEEMEDAFQGNLCRCTGYRPILQGYKTLCKKSSTSNGCCGGGGLGNGGSCMELNGNKDTETQVADTLFDESQFKPYDPKQDIIFPAELQLDSKSIRGQSLRFIGSNVTWFKPSSLEELLRLKDMYPNGKCIGGNTEVGIETRFKQLNYPVMIHVSDIKELITICVDTDNNVLKIGGAASLTQIKQFCLNRAQSNQRHGTVEKD